MPSEGNRPVASYRSEGRTTTDQPFGVRSFRCSLYKKRTALMRSVILILVLCLFLGLRLFFFGFFLSLLFCLGFTLFPGETSLFSLFS